MVEKIYVTYNDVSANFLGAAVMMMLSDGLSGFIKSCLLTADWSPPLYRSIRCARRLPSSFWPTSSPSS